MMDPGVMITSSAVSARAGGEGEEEEEGGSECSSATRARSSGDPRTGA